MQCLPPARCDRGAVSELLTVAGEYGEHGASTTAPLGSPAVGVLTLDRAGVLIAGLEEHGRDDDARRAADDGGAAAVVTLRRIAGRLAHPPDRPTPTPGHQRRGCHHPRREIPARNHGRHRFGRQRIRLDQTGVRRREVKLTQTFSSQYKDTSLRLLHPPAGEVSQPDRTHRPARHTGEVCLHEEVADAAELERCIRIIVVRKRHGIFGVVPRKVLPAAGVITVRDSPWVAGVRVHGGRPDQQGGHHEHCRSQLPLRPAV
jgi:hypothetical protein